MRGVRPNFLADPRHCTWSARTNICGVQGAPAPPNCLDQIQADGIDRLWDGPRNRHGKRIWPAYDRGVGLGTSQSTQGSTTQVLRWAMFDNTFVGNNLYEDQKSIDLAAHLSPKKGQRSPEEDGARGEDLGPS